MNPLFELYLKVHGKEDEPDLYKFVIWARSQADQYKLQNKITSIYDYDHYATWLKEKFAQYE
jgi:hypothetical protein